MLKISTDAFNAMIAHAKSKAPIEACGYLSGTGNHAVVAHTMTNIDNSEEHFSFDPKEQFAAMKAAQKEGRRLIVCYHSHPASPARPSEEDIRLAFDPSIYYVIVSLAEASPVVRAFKIKNGVVEQIETEITL